MRRVATSWKVIEAVLKEHAHSAYQALRPPTSMNSIRKLEAQIGTTLPQSFVSSLRIHDGMHHGPVFCNYHFLLSVRGISEWWRICMDNPWDRPGPRYYHSKRIKGELRWRAAWLPIAQDDGGNLLGIDLDPGPAGSVGQVFNWNNYGAPTPKVLTDSYAAWLHLIAEELFHRRFTLNEWGDIQLRKQLA